MWGCKTHWFRLPSRLRSRIWATYRPRQEVDKRPSAEYLSAAAAVQEWALKDIAAEQRRKDLQTIVEFVERGAPEARDEVLRWIVEVITGTQGSGKPLDAEQRRKDLQTIVEFVERGAPEARDEVLRWIVEVLNEVLLDLANGGKGGLAVVPEATT